MTGTRRKHTPGPWSLTRIDEESGLIGWWITGPKGESICNVYDAPDDPDAAGNAALIATVPDLLAKLQQVETDDAEGDAILQALYPTILEQRAAEDEAKRHEGWMAAVDWYFEQTAAKKSRGIVKATAACPFLDIKKEGA